MFQFLRTGRPQAALPPAPRLVLRVAFAGSQKLEEGAQERLRGRLQEILRFLGRQLAERLPGSPGSPADAPPVTGFYDGQTPPLLRLVTGLCQGADAVAGQVLQQLAEESVAGQPDSAGVRPPACELAAVLPFDVATYRHSRPEDFRAEFDRQAQRCAYLLTLDGRYDKPDPDTDLAKLRRQRGYRAQSAQLLRHGDLLIAAANPDDPSKAGGTLETIRNALAFHLPVLLIHTGTGDVRLFEPDDDFSAALSLPPDPGADWSHRLAWHVSRIVAGPDLHVASSAPAAAHSSAVLTPPHPLLTEYFQQPLIPPQRWDAGGRAQNRPTLREGCWTWFEGRFRTGRGPNRDPALAPYALYRSRATSLNYHYSGLYRGAFLLNYLFAVAAVGLAALSLVLMIWGASRSATTNPPETRAHVAPNSPPLSTTKPEAVSAALPEHDVRTDVLYATLFGLALAKLAILVFIYRNTHWANHEKWSDRAVDYRYLAERLRSLFYLPLVGSYHPPAAIPLQNDSRSVRQSAVDWLFAAIVRSVSPAEFSEPLAIATHDGRGSMVVRVVRTDPRSALTTIRDHWIAEQGVYHARNARTMESIYGFVEGLSQRLGKVVMVIVGIDAVLLCADLAHWLPAGLSHGFHALAPGLVFIATVLPAAVAALNGIRFQSECRRLAERSDVMQQILVGQHSVASTEQGAPSSGHWLTADQWLARLRAQSPDTDPAGWTLDVMQFAERLATDFVDEVAEWSVLYAKELPEPG